jgi:HD-GYP domain-containing protein (c-di-GMP phosphodiesterase class II)
MLASQSATILQISELYDQITTLYQELMMSYNETRKMFHGFINGITSFIDRKDPYTRGHSQRVADFSVAVATQMNLPDEMIHHIRIGGIIHDVGKIGVADDVLKKPGRLDDDEMGQMKKHPTYGIELLSDADLLRLLPIERQAIEEHHERLDGTGYPRGLRGVRERTDGTEDENGISLIGRIVAVADFFDALTSDRPYREALPVDEVLDMMQKSSGTHFDPVCVEALIEARNRGRIKTQRERPEYKRANGR